MICDLWVPAPPPAGQRVASSKSGNHPFVDIARWSDREPLQTFVAFHET